MVMEYTDEDDKLLKRLQEDFYFGKGPDDPSFTVRMDRLERMTKQAIALAAGLASAGELVVEGIKFVAHVLSSTSVVH
jgi:hypothetical protein